MSEINKNLQELKNNFSASRESSVGKKCFFFIFINLENIFMAFSNLSGQPLLSQTVMSPCVFPFKFISSYSYFISFLFLPFPSLLISFLSRHFDSKLWRKFVHLGINYVRNYNVDVLRCKRTKSYPAVFSFYRYRKFSSSATTLFPFPTIIIVILFIICIEHAKKCTCGLVT